MKYMRSLAIFCPLMLTTAFTLPSKDKVNDEELDVKFRIEICSYENHVPYDKVESMRKLGKVLVVKKNGWASYYSKEYATEAEATTQLPYYINAGFENAREVAQIGDEYLTLEEYKKYKKDKKEGKDPSIRIYK
jgi:ribosomal protein L7Ae-like RNA K-turn-binding protein